MLRFITGVLAIGLAGCSSQPLDRDQALKNLKSQADEVRRAMLQEDHQRMADLTHPTLVEKLGGKTRFVQRLTAMAAEMKGQGFGFKAITFSEPPDLVEASGEVYAIVPFKLDMTGPGGAHGVQPSALIGVSKDRGRSWTFLDSSGVAGDPEKLRQILPNFPSTLPLPAKEEARWEKR